MKDDIADATLFLKRANEFCFFRRTTPVAVALKLNCSVFRNRNSCRVLPFYRNFFALKSLSWLILKPCKFVVPNWRQRIMKCLDSEEHNECSQMVKLKT